VPPAALLAPSTAPDTVPPVPALEATVPTPPPPPAGTADAAPPPAGTVDAAPLPAGTVEAAPLPAGTVEALLPAEGVWSGHPAPDAEEDEEADALVLGVPPPMLGEECELAEAPGEEPECPEPEPPPPSEAEEAACDPAAPPPAPPPDPAVAAEPPPPADPAAAAPPPPPPPDPDPDPAPAPPPAPPPPPDAPAAPDDEPPAAPAPAAPAAPAPAAPAPWPAAFSKPFTDAGETPALCSSLCSNEPGEALPNPRASLGNFTPCNAFPNPPGKPCDANRSTCSSAIPSAAIAITTPAKLDRDSRNSIVCIAFPEPPNSAANPGNPDATHAPEGSRRNSARNSGSTNNRSIKRPASSS